MKNEKIKIIEDNNNLIYTKNENNNINENKEEIIKKNYKYK